MKGRIETPVFNRSFASAIIKWLQQAGQEHESLIDLMSDPDHVDESMALATLKNYESIVREIYKAKRCAWAAFGGQP